MQSDRRNSSREAGFTLIEALFATLVMTFILAAIATVTAQWLPNWNRGLTIAQRGELVTTGLDRLAADIASVEWVSPGDLKAPPLFEGTPLSLTFVRTALGPNAGLGLEIVRVSEVSNDGALALVRTTAPFMPGTSGDALNYVPLANPVVIAGRPYRVSFAYAGSDRIWKDTWQNQPQLPRAVRILIRDASTSRGLAVSTVATIRAELPVRCLGPSRTPECPQPATASISSPIPPSPGAPSTNTPATNVSPVPAAGMQR